MDAQLIWEQVKKEPEMWALSRVWNQENNGEIYPMQSAWLATIGEGYDGAWCWQSELRIFGWCGSLEDAQNAAREYVVMRAGDQDPPDPPMLRLSQGS